MRQLLAKETKKKRLFFYINRKLERERLIKKTVKLDSVPGGDVKWQWGTKTVKNEQMRQKLTY